MIAMGTNAAVWNWQWTATFAVMIGYFVSAMLLINDFKYIPILIGVLSTLLGMYVIAVG